PRGLREDIGRITDDPNVLPAALDEGRKRLRVEFEHMAPVASGSHSTFSFASRSCSSALRATPGWTHAPRCHSRAERGPPETGVGAGIRGFAQVQPPAGYADRENAALAPGACPRCHVDSNSCLCSRVM